METYLDFCHIYNGEDIQPSKLSDEEKTIWTIERLAVRTAHRRDIPLEKCKRFFSEHIENMLMKWRPYDWRELMKIYSSNTPIIK